MTDDASRRCPRGPTSHTTSGMFQEGISLASHCRHTNFLSAWEFEL
jgi:hypothetical protein